jgi:hypothetical protein
LRKENNGEYGTGSRSLRHCFDEASLEHGLGTVLVVKEKLREIIYDVCSSPCTGN